MRLASARSQQCLSVRKSDLDTGHDEQPWIFTDPMARHAALLGSYGPGYHSQPVLQYCLAETRVLHPSSPHPGLLRLSHPHGLCVFLPRNILCCANRTDNRQMSPQKATSTEVWTQFNNGGDWPTMALSVFVGLIGSVFANNGKRRLSPKIGRQITIDNVSARYRLRCACKLSGPIHRMEF